jgi:hypothetical protein
MALIIDVLGLEVNPVGHRTVYPKSQSFCAKFVGLLAILLQILLHDPRVLGPGNLGDVQCCLENRVHAKQS